MIRAGSVCVALVFAFIVTAANIAAAEAEPGTPAAMLAAALKSPDAAVRRGALYDAKHFDEACGPVIAGALKDEDAQVRIAAAETFARMYWGYSGWRQRQKREAEADPTLSAAVPASVQSDIDALTDGLTDRDPGVRRAAAQALTTFGPDAARASRGLTRCVKTGPAKVRAEAINTLRSIGPPAWDELPTLTYLLAGLGKTSRAALAGAIDAIDPGNQTAVACLFQLLQDTDASVRRAAARELFSCSHREKRLTEALIRLSVTDTDEGTRTGVVEALRARAWDPELRAADRHAAAAALARALRDPSECVRQKAVRGLAGSGPTAAPFVSDLVAALRDPTSEMRGEAAQALGRLGPAARKATDALVKLAKADPLARAEAIRAIGTVGSSSEQLPFLLHSLDDKDAKVRAAAAFAMRALRSDADVTAAVPGLTLALSDPEDAVRADAASALSKYGQRAAPARKALMALVNDPDPFVAIAVRIALENIKCVD